MWLTRFIDRVLGGRLEGAPAAQARRVAEVLDRRGVFDSDAALLEALLEVLPDDEPLTDEALARVARAVRMSPAGEVDIDPAAQLDFWAALARRFPDSGYAHACHGDALLAAGDSHRALAPLLAAVEHEPALLPEFGDDLAPLAERVGGQALVRYRVADLRARLDDPEQAEEVREAYSELLEDYRGDDDAIARIRELGAEINRLVAENKLPRAIVRRTR